jgi:S1-C subfamily serine protease
MISKLMLNHVLKSFSYFTLILCILLLPNPFSLCTDLYALDDISKIRNSVVRIKATWQAPDYSVPWNPGRILEKQGSGFLISGNRILTNAHLASNARLIAVEKEDDSKKYEAKVKFIAHDCDLAILEVLDKTFFEGISPLPIGGIPSLDSTVAVIGYPIGGERLSVTRGVVSRIDYQIYSHSVIDQHLAIQIDAAINPGNSGGPVIQNNAVVGVAFQAYSKMIAQNVGYMIPVPVIHRFLKDVEDGQYDGYVDLSIRHFPLLNDMHRRALGLKTEGYGVMVSKVYMAGGATNILKPGDVLLAIDGLPIFSNGYVLMGNERLLLEEVVERKFKEESVRLKILRQGKELEVTVPLSYPWPFLMLARRHDVLPRFVVFGGLVFQPLSEVSAKAPEIKQINAGYQYYYYLENEFYKERPEIIVLSKILPDPVNVYLRRFLYSIVEGINDHKVRTLEDMSSAFKEPSDF